MKEALHNLGIEWTALIAQGVNFGILLLVLWKFVYKPVLKILDDRSKKVEESIKNAQLIEEKLAKASDESAKIIENAKKEAGKIISESKNSAKEISQKILCDAEEKSKKIISDTNLAVAKEKEEIFESVKTEVASLVKTSVAAILSDDKLNVNDKLVNEALDKFSK
jgi:F-type H+-transporting ATPase subunit b